MIIVVYILVYTNCFLFVLLSILDNIKLHYLLITYNGVVYYILKNNPKFYIKNYNFICIFYTIMV